MINKVSTTDKSTPLKNFFFKSKTVSNKKLLKKSIINVIKDEKGICDRSRSLLNFYWSDDKFVEKQKRWENETKRLRKHYK